MSAHDLKQRTFDHTRRGIDRNLILRVRQWALGITDAAAGKSPDMLIRATERLFKIDEHGIGTGLVLTLGHGFIHQGEGCLAPYIGQYKHHHSNLTASRRGLALRQKHN